MHPQVKWSTDSVGTDAIDKPHTSLPENAVGPRQKMRPEDVKIDVEAGSIKVYVAI